MHHHVVVHLDEAVGGRVLDARERNGRHGIVALVPLDQLPKIEPREHVPVHRDHRPAVLDVPRGVLDAARGSQSAVFDRIVHGEAVEVEPGEVFLDGGRQVTHGEHRSVEPPALEEVQHVAHKRPVPQGHQRLRGIVGDRTQPSPLSPNKNDGLHRSRSLHQPQYSG